MKPRRGSLGKTARPRLSGILPRRRLFELLDQGRQGPAIWVSGPPGCGKTTLVASWLDHAAMSSLWYQVDEGDADVATFFYYLSAAVADLEAGEALPLLSPEHQANLPQFTRRYVQQLFAQLPGPFTLVFDGCHPGGGSYMSCEYQMNTPFQGAGTCSFSNGARYRVHIGN